MGIPKKAIRRESPETTDRGSTSRANSKPKPSPSPGPAPQKPVSRNSGSTGSRTGKRDSNRSPGSRGVQTSSVKAEKKSSKSKGNTKRGSKRGKASDNIRGNSSQVPEGFMRDSKTGILYKMIPKVKVVDGRPELAINNFDIDDLQGEANTYLSHLRVPPDREEMKRLRLERERAEIEKIKAFDQEFQEELDAQKEEESKQEW